MDRRQLKLVIARGKDCKAEFKEDVGGMEKDLVAFAKSSDGGD